ncbi:MAG: DUF4397 domain-containing protein [Gammaproteobacteria bacterium]|nr:DUF4397 domain-containing protein [Gammaproteobacteria bacterium]NNC96972.1 DUF4397 domain-containing protein [Gammaproteobacteria bacterium]NNM13417.1 DUF4397 domain-containing protein [Gammaproteobacteria bacterium]
MHVNPIFNLGQRLFSAIICATILIFLSACHDEPQIATLQILHASADAPDLRISDDGFLFADNFTYSSATGKVDLGSGVHDVTVSAILPNGNTSSRFSISQRDFPANTNTLVIASNTYSAMEPYIVVQNDDAIDAESARVRVIHLAPNAPMVDVYVTAPDVELANAAPQTTLSFKQETANLNFTAGSVQVRLTHFNTQEVIFDSGPLSISGGVDSTIVAVDSTNIGDSPVSLLFLGNNTSQLLIDSAAASRVRVVHASPDSPNIDVALDDDFSNLAFSDLAFATDSGYSDFIPSSYNLKVVESVTSTPVLLDDTLSFVLGSSHTYVVLDTAANLQSIFTNRNHRRIATDARLDIIHAASQSGNVDIYLESPGTDPSTSSPEFTNVPLTGTTNFRSQAPGTYDLTVTETGTTNTIVDATEVTLNARGLYTVVVVDDQITAADNDGLPASLMLLDDFVAN